MADALGCLLGSCGRCNKELELILAGELWPMYVELWLMPARERLSLGGSIVTEGRSSSLSRYWGEVIVAGEK